MKKSMVFIAFFLVVFLNSAFAQLGIGTSTPNPNAVLELSSANQGMKFPRLTTSQRNNISLPAKGLTIFNTDINCLMTNFGTPSVPVWKCIGGFPISISTNGTAIVTSYGDPTCNTNSISGVMTKGIAVSGVTMTLFANVTQIGTWNLTATQNGVTFTGSGTFVATGCQSITLVASGIPTNTGSFSWITNTTPAANVTATVFDQIPLTITLAQNRIYMVASIYDQDFLPYVAPTVSASTATQAANGVNEAVTLNVQGSITTAGVNLKIPVTVTGSGTLPAFNSTFNIPASLTEDGIARNVTFSWASQSYTLSTTSINATIVAIGGTLNVKKLDVNAGIGNDGFGVLLGTFIYPYNYLGNTTTYKVCAISAIPDKMFGLADNSGDTTTHMMLYLPISTADGNTWLNNNLGAHYANVNHSSFNLAQQALSANDRLAMGSSFQWGRKPDGHELITYTIGNITPVYTSVTIKTNTPSHSQFIKNLNTTPFDWRTSQDNTLWATEQSENNPCPQGFRVPTLTEITTLFSSSSITSVATAASSILKFSVGGFRDFTTNYFNATDQYGYYWSSSVSGVYAGNMFIGPPLATYYSQRAASMSVRCIKN
jgi:hypothetical protein